MPDDLQPPPEILPPGTPLPGDEAQEGKRQLKQLVDGLAAATRPLGKVLGKVILVLAAGNLAFTGTFTWLVGTHTGVRLGLVIAVATILGLAVAMLVEARFTLIAMTALPARLVTHTEVLRDFLRRHQGNWQVSREVDSATGALKLVATLRSAGDDLGALFGEDSPARNLAKPWFWGALVAAVGVSALALALWLPLALLGLLFR